MKTYKAIFDIPDDIIPPSVVGFQVVKPVQTEKGIQMLPQIYKATLLPINSVIEDYEEAKDDED